MNKTCARCEKTVYPTEELKCLDKRPRVSHKQRAAMFKFMLQHPEIAKGTRVTEPDVAIKKANLIKEMSSILNNIDMGATKTPEKWWKCWQDWRCDTKAKANRIKKFRGRPGDMPGPPPLTELEERLLQFCGVQMNNDDEVPDPLDAWHKGCFKCQECGMTLNMRTYKGYGKLPYCEAHVPKAKHTTMAETPELKRIAENTKLQSNVKYHADFEKSKGKFTQVADDPETLRIRANTRIFSNVTYHGDLEKKAQMEKQRQINENGELVDVTADYHQQIDNYASEMLPPPHLPPKSHYQTPVTHYQPPLSTQNVQYHQNHQNHNSIPTQNHSQSQIHSQNHSQSQIQAQNHSQSQIHSQNHPQSQIHSQNPQNQHSQNQSYSQNQHTQNQSHSQSRYDQSRQEQKYDYYKKEEYYGYQPGYQNIGKIQDYDPETDGPRAPINSPRAMPTLVYNSNDNRGAHQPSQSQPRQIGRVTDLDPLAKEVPRASNNHQPPAPAPQVNQKVYIAMYDYEANDNDEVSFREGDLIGNVSSIDEGWMTGQVLRTGRAGMLPANYVVERPPY